MSKDVNEIQLLIDEIHRLISNGEYHTVNDMVQYIIENVEKCISLENIRNFIINSGFNIVVGNPMEEDRAKVDDRDKTQSFFFFDFHFEFRDFQFFNPFSIVIRTRSFLFKFKEEWNFAGKLRWSQFNSGCVHSNDSLGNLTCPSP